MAIPTVSTAPAPSSATTSGTSAIQPTQPEPWGDSAAMPRPAAATAAARRRTLGWLVAIVAAVLGVFAVCLVDAMAWIGRPFPGFLFLQNGIAVSIGRGEWSHARYRSVPFSRVLAVDGRPVAGGRDVHAYVAAAPVGKPIAYT